MRVYSETATQRKDLILAALGKTWLWRRNPEFVPPSSYNRIRVAQFTRHDPLHVASLKAMVQRVKNGKSESHITRRQTRSRSVKNSFVRSNLPLEVVLLILDQLPGVRDVYYATVAFGWTLPPAYWKAKFPCQVVVELDELDLDELEDRDWKYLYGEYVRIMCLQKPPGLENRRRIFRILERTKEDFLEVLEEDRTNKKRTADEMLAG